jgi:hypothetical protein
MVMKKLVSSLLKFGGVISVSWWLGGMMYFMMVTKHFRDEEKHEDMAKNLSSYLGGVSQRGASAISEPDAKALGITKSSPRVIRDRNPDWHSGITTVPNKWRSYYNPASRYINHNPDIQ